MNLSFDVTTAVFEFISVVAAALDVQQLHKDKDAKGFNVWMKFYWVSYSVWSLYLSFKIGLFLTCLMITMWFPIYCFGIIQVFRYRRLRKK